MFKEWNEQEATIRAHHGPQKSRSSAGSGPQILLSAGMHWWLNLSPATSNRLDSESTLAMPPTYPIPTKMTVRTASLALLVPHHFWGVSPILYFMRQNSEVFSTWAWAPKLGSWEFSFIGQTGCRERRSEHKGPLYRRTHRGLSPHRSSQWYSMRFQRTTWHWNGPNQNTCENSQKENKLSVWWRMLVIPALGRQKQVGPGTPGQSVYLTWWALDQRHHLTTKTKKCTHSPRIWS